ncbi:uncharacterized protein LOC110429301 [Herrania umbratica]|uniref:Uncharacterized protein LOC110429301 n=1 Tax=Herrania umbratica TaxID=108875 RepID=A0A6J1BPJ2_9ROSI|nr:uncharacterized protein LOC110429301 [Herrania umbratica]
MKAFLKGVNLWNVVENKTEEPVLRNNATPAQVKQHEEDVAKKYRALSFIHFAVTKSVFNRIMGCEIAKQAWNKLEEEFLGSSRNKQIRLQNLRKLYELLRMKDSQTVQEFIDAVMKVVKDISQLAISNLVNILEVDEQKRAARKNEKTDLAFTARMKGKARAVASTKKNVSEIKDKEKGSHVERVCKNKYDANEKITNAAKNVESSEEQLFMATCSNMTNDAQWPLDSGNSNQ